MSSGFPPRAKLAQVAASLAAHLPEQFVGLISAPRYADDAAALARIADATALAGAIDRMPEQEAGWLADMLLSRWRRIADAVLDPAVAILGPSEVWVADIPREIVLRIVTSGLDDDWQAEWSIQQREGSGGAEGLLVLPYPDRPDHCFAAVRVFGRADGSRGVFSARYQAPVRQIVLDLDGERRRLVLRDQAGAPGSAVSVEIAGAERTTGPDGVLALEQSLPRGVRVRIGGCEVAV